jgi:hypothetical protein
MRIISIIAWKIFDVDAAAVGVMHPPRPHIPDFMEPSRVPTRRGRVGATAVQLFTPIALVPGAVDRYTVTPKRGPSPAAVAQDVAVPASPKAVPSTGRKTYEGFRKGKLGKLLQDWKSRTSPVPRFDHKTQKQVVEFLSFYGESTDGQFGTDKVHKPNLNSADQENIANGIITPISHGDVTIHLVMPPIYKAGHTGVYNIVDHPTKVIKYHAYCLHIDTDPFDATVVEAYFMKRLAEADLTLNVDYYSGYVSERGTLTEADRKIKDVSCPWGVTPHIRYMIMDKVGPSLLTYMSTGGRARIPFLEAMKLGKQMIELMKKLHNLNIIHGDAHMGNFAFKTDDPSSGLILIDFGRAKIVDEVPPASMPSSACRMLHPFAALWEMDGCKVSFRDDVYRAVQMTAMSLYGMYHFNYLNSLITRLKVGDPERNANLNPAFNEIEYRRIKREADFWELGPTINLRWVLRSTDEPTRVQIRNHLKTISELTVAPTQPYAKPDYDAIIAHYDAIIAILTPPIVAGPHAAAP